MSGRWRSFACSCSKQLQLVEDSDIMRLLGDFASGCSLSNRVQDVLQRDRTRGGARIILEPLGKTMRQFAERPLVIAFMPFGHFLQFLDFVTGKRG